jgi:DnaJ-class molecular chaperone
MEKSGANRNNNSTNCMKTAMKSVILTLATMGSLVVMGVISIVPAHGAVHSSFSAPDGRMKTCEKCDGSGKRFGGKCFDCNGRGIVHWDGKKQQDLSRGIRNCPNCSGVGKKDGSTCIKCNGSGIVNANGMPQRFDGLKKCPSCGGSGHASALGMRNCIKCNGTGIIRHNGMPQTR